MRATMIDATAFARVVAESLLEAKVAALPLAARALEVGAHAAGLAVQQRSWGHGSGTSASMSSPIR